MPAGSSFTSRLDSKAVSHNTALPHTLNTVPHTSGAGVRESTCAAAESPTLLAGQVSVANIWRMASSNQEQDTVVPARAWVAWRTVHQSGRRSKRKGLGGAQGLWLYQGKSTRGVPTAAMDVYQEKKCQALFAHEQNLNLSPISLLP